MASLRSWDALRWHSSVEGTLIVTFEDSPQSDLPSPISIPDSEILESEIPDSENLDSWIPENPHPLPPPFNINNKIKLNFEEGEREEEGEFQDSGILERNFGKPPPSSTASALLAAYHSLTRLHPTPPHKRMILEQVTDPDLWRATLEHWLSHGWNPRNLAGMLELYQRGGAAGCRYCSPNAAERNPSLAGIDQLEQELKRNGRL